MKHLLGERSWRLVEYRCTRNSGASHLSWSTLGPCGPNTEVDARLLLGFEHAEGGCLPEQLGNALMCREATQTLQDPAWVGEGVMSRNQNPASQNSSMPMDPEPSESSARKKRFSSLCAKGNRSTKVDSVAAQLSVGCERCEPPPGQGGAACFSAPAESPSARS